MAEPVSFSVAGGMCRLTFRPGLWSAAMNRALPFSRLSSVQESRVTDSTQPVSQADMAWATGEARKVVAQRAADQRIPPPIESSLGNLIADLQALKTPRLSSRADSEELDAASLYVLRFAEACDRHLRDIGEEIAASVPGSFDRSLFEYQFFGAVDGNALFEIETAKDEAAEEEEHPEEFAE